MLAMLVLAIELVEARSPASNQKATAKKRAPGSSSQSRFDLLQVCMTLSFTTTCRFIPAHKEETDEIRKNLAAACIDDNCPRVGSRGAGVQKNSGASS
jgi:hypothetical protein